MRWIIYSGKEANDMTFTYLLISASAGYTLTSATLSLTKMTGRPLIPAKIRVNAFLGVVLGCVRVKSVMLKKGFGLQSHLISLYSLTFVQ